MKQLITLLIVLITIFPALIIGVIAAPFGLSDEVAEGYEGWIQGICECESTGRAI